MKFDQDLYTVVEGLARKHNMSVEEFIAEVFKHYVDLDDYVMKINPGEKSFEVFDVEPLAKQKDVDDLYRKYEQIVKEVGRMEKDLALMENFLREKFGYKRW